MSLVLVLHLPLSFLFTFFRSFFFTFLFLFFLFSFLLYQTGISLSPFQISKAKEFTTAQGLENKMEYQVADAMAMPFKDNSFDLS